MFMLCFFYRWGIKGFLVCHFNRVLRICVTNSSFLTWFLNSPISNGLTYFSLDSELKLCCYSLGVDYHCDIDSRLLRHFSRMSQGGSIQRTREGCVYRGTEGGGHERGRQWSKENGKGAVEEVRKEGLYPYPPPFWKQVTPLHGPNLINYCWSFGYITRVRIGLGASGGELGKVREGRVGKV
jgi:hypothetical protein